MPTILVWVEKKLGAHVAVYADGKSATATATNMTEIVFEGNAISISPVRFFGYLVEGDIETLFNYLSEEGIQSRVDQAEPRPASRVTGRNFRLIEQSGEA